MEIVLGVIVMVLLPAALSWGICTGMRVFSPDSSRRRRVALGALLAGLIPTLVPLLALLENGLSDGLVPVLAVMLVGVLMAVIVGLPVAVRTTRKDFPG